MAVVPFRVALCSLLVGYLANNVLPARLGEVVRSHDLGERTGLSRSTILGHDRRRARRGHDGRGDDRGGRDPRALGARDRGLGGAGRLRRDGAARGGRLRWRIYAHRLPGAERVTAFIARWPRVHAALVRLRTGLAIAGDLRTMTAAVVLSLGSWSFTVLAFAAAAQAVDVEPTMGQAALLAAGTNLATAIPAASGIRGHLRAGGGHDRGLGGDRPRVRRSRSRSCVHVTTLLITSVGGVAVLVFGGRRRRVTERTPRGAGRSAAGGER